MRYIPPELLERIQKLNQTIFENADPKMEATLELLHQQITSKVLYSIGGEVGKIDFCARREDPDGPVTEMFFIAIVGGNAYVYRSFIISQEFGVLIAPFFQWGLADDAACEFDGEWQLNSSGNKVFVTKSDPFFFRQHGGHIYSRHGANESERLVVAGVGDTKIAALRGWEDTQIIAGGYEVEFTALRLDTSVIEGAGISVRKAQFAEFNVENELEAPEENAVITVQQTVGNQGLVLFYTRNGTPKAMYKADWVTPWSEESTIPLKGNLNDVNLFRGVEPGRFGYIGERGGFIEMAVTEEFHYTPEEPLEVGPGLSASIIQRADGTLSMYYLQSDRRIAAAEAVHHDWESIEIINMDIQHTGAGLGHLRAKDLFDGDIYIVWGEGGDYMLGKALDSEELDEYLIAQGSLSFSLSNPIAQATLEIESIPPRVPRVGKPVWDGDTITWQTVAADEPIHTWPEQEIEFFVVDDASLPLEGVEIDVEKEW